MLGAGAALADESRLPGEAAPAQAESPAQQGAAAEVKAAKGVENKEPVEEGTSFVVEVQGEDGSVQGSVSFDVQ